MSSSSGRDTLEEYGGRYRLGPGRTLEIAFDTPGDAPLTGEVFGEEGLPLRIQIFFQRNADGRQIDGLTDKGARGTGVPPFTPDAAALSEYAGTYDTARRPYRPPGCGSRQVLYR